MGVEDAVLGVDGDELDALRNIKKGKAKESNKKKSLCAEDSLNLSWLKPLGPRPCRESGPPHSLQLGPSPTPVHGMRPHGQPVSEMTRGRMVVETCGCNGLWPLVVEKPVAAIPCGPWL